MPRTTSHIPARQVGPDRPAPTDLEGRLAEMFATFIRDAVADGTPLGPLAVLLKRDAAGVLSASAFPKFEAIVHRAIDRAVSTVKAED